MVRPFRCLAWMLPAVAAIAGAAGPATIEWHAMGTRVRLAVRGDDAAQAAPAMAEAARAALEAVESETSAFRPDSDVARVSAAAGNGEWVEVGADFAAALNTALAVAEASGDAFNPLVAPLMEAHGFARGGVAASDDPALRDLAGIGQRPGGCRLAQPGMAFDFGGVAKGVGADRAADAARTVATNDFLLDVGGTLVGRGDWQIGLRDPRGPDGAPPLRVFPLPDGTAAATSGNYERFAVNANGTRTGHLFDPRTGRPAGDGVLQCTVLAPTAAEADAWSTAMFVLGPDAGRAVLSNATPLAVLWVLGTPDGNVRLVRAPLGGNRAIPFSREATAE